MLESVDRFRSGILAYGRWIAGAVVFVVLLTPSAAPAERIYYACGTTLEEIIECWASVREWKEDNEEHDVIILPQPFDSSEARKQYENIHSKQQQSPQSADSESILSRNEGHRGIPIHLLRIDIVDVPHLAARHEEGNGLAPEARRFGILNLSEFVNANPSKKEEWCEHMRAQIDKMQDQALYAPPGDDPKLSFWECDGQPGNQPGSFFAIPYFVDVASIIGNTRIHAPATMKDGWNGFLRSVAQSDREASNAPELESDNAEATVPYAFQITATESMIANFFEWLFESKDSERISHSRREFVNAVKEEWPGSENGKLSPFGEKLKLLHQLAAQSRGAGASSGDELTTLEHFEDGRVKYMRNWPFAYARLTKQDSGMSDQIDIRPLPGRSTLGGGYLAISDREGMTNGMKSAVFELAMHLASENSQKKRAADFGVLPTLADLYTKDHSKILAERPYFRTMHKAMENAIVRPAKAFGEDYRPVMNAVAQELCDFFHTKIDDEDYPDETDALRNNIVSIFESGASNSEAESTQSESDSSCSG